MASMREQIAWNKARHGVLDTRKIQRAIGATEDGVWGPETITKLEAWQYRQGLRIDGLVGMETIARIEHESEHEIRSLTPEERDKVIEHTVLVESAGAHDPYAAANLDAEYRGWFDTPRRGPDHERLTPEERAWMRETDPDAGSPHWASRFNADGGTHIGLSWGIIQFTQDGGALGRVLARAEQIEPGVMRRVFGPDAGALLAMVTSSEKGRANAGDGARSARVQRIGGADLWESPWRERFEKAAKIEVFRRAQREIAAEDYLEPAIEICREHGATAQTSLAIAFDVAVQFGPGAARRFHRRADDPTDAEFVVMELPEARRARRWRILEQCEIAVHYRELERR